MSICSVDNNLALKLQDARKFWTKSQFHLPSFREMQIFDIMNYEKFLKIHFWYSIIIMLMLLVLYIWYYCWWCCSFMNEKHNISIELQRSALLLKRRDSKHIEGSNYFTIKPPTFSGESTMLFIFPRVSAQYLFASYKNLLMTSEHCSFNKKIILWFLSA